MAKDPSVQSVIVNRPVADTSRFAGQGAKAWADAAGAFSDFFGGMLKQSEEDEADKTEQINEAMLQRMELVVQSDLKRARQAAETGDFTPFMNVEQAHQKFYQVNVPKMIGRNLAIGDREEYEAALNDIPAGTDPTEFTAKFFADKTKNLNIFASREYLTTAQKFASDKIKEWEKTQANTISLANKQRIPTFLKAGLQDGTITNLGQLEQFSNRAAAADPGHYAEQLPKYRDIVDRELARIATDPNNPAAIRALKMIQAKDPNRNGTSVVDRLGVDYDKIVKENLAKSERVMSAGAFEVLKEADIRIARMSAGVAKDDSWSKIQADLFSKFGEYGGTTSNPKFLTVWKKFLTEFGKNSVTSNALDVFVSTGRFHGDDKTKKDVLSILKTRGDLEKRNELLRVAGPTNDIIQEWTNRITSLDLKAVAEVKAVQGQLPLESFLPDGPAMAMYIAGSSAPGDEEAKIRMEKIQQNLAQTGEKFSGHFARRFNVGQGSLDDRTAGTGGIRSVNFILKKFLKDLTDEEMAAIGMPEGTKVDELSQGVLNRLSRLLDAASVATLDRPNTDEKVVLRTMYDYARGEFEILPTADGKKRVINRVTPKAIIDSTGRKIEGKPFDEKTLEGFNEYMDRDYIDNSPLRGLRADKRTAIDGTTIMTHTNMAGDEVDFRLPLTRPDRPTVVDLEWVEEGGFMEGAFEVISKNEEEGTATIRVIAPGDDVDLDPDNPAQGPRINLDERSYLQYDPETSTWEARYVDLGVSDEENAWRSLSDFIGLTLKKDDVRASFQELDETQRKAVLRQFSRVEPMTWTDEELRRRAMGKPGNPKIQAELRRRRRGGKRIDAQDIGPAPAGAGLNVNAVPNEGPTSPEERAREQADADDILFDGVTNGHFTAEAVKKAKSMSDDPKEQITEANLQSMVNGHFFDRLDEPEGEHFMAKFSKFIEGVEGFEGYVYDDHSGVNTVAWSKSDKKGDPTIGYGFNLNRPDAEILLNRIGKNKRRLLEGKDTINRQEAQELLEAVNRANLIFLRKHFKGIMMEKHKWMALLSLTYNSRWKNNRPTLIGPKITKAIKNQDWEAAAWEIEFNSGGGVPPSLQKGINARRRKEAQLFRGVDL